LCREGENLRKDSFVEEDAMKAALVFTGSGPILVLTTYESFADPGFVEKLEAKGLDKFIAHEVSVELAKKKYGQHFDVVMKDVKVTDDLRVLDYNGHRVFHNFSFKDLGAPYQHE
jgi:hypothetical protein